MKDKFQAKDIQEVLRVPKPRYEYLVTKMGIKPDVLEVEGQGKSHLYSLRNVLQFAYAHHASRLGFTPKAVKDMLHVIDTHPTIKGMGILDPSAQCTITLFYVEHRDIAFFKLLYIAGERRSEVNVTTDGQPLEEQLARLKKEHLRGNVVKTLIERPDLKWLFKSDNKIQKLKHADAYIALNLSMIKKRIMRNIEKMK